MAKALTEQDVRRLRDLRARGMLNVRWEAMFLGLAAETIRRAVRGETFAHLKMQPLLDEAKLERAAAESQEKLQRLLAAEKERAALPGKILDDLAGEPQDTEFTNRDLAKKKGYL